MELLSIYKPKAISAGEDILIGLITLLSIPIFRVSLLLLEISSPFTNSVLTRFVRYNAPAFAGGYVVEVLAPRRIIETRISPERSMGK